MDSQELQEYMIVLSYNNFLEKVGVKHETSCAYNRRLNSLVEWGVQAVKNVLKKIGSSGSLKQIVDDLNSLEHSNEYTTPSEMMTGRVVRSLIPAFGRRKIDLA